MRCLLPSSRTLCYQKSAGKVQTNTTAKRRNATLLSNFFFLHKKNTFLGPSAHCLNIRHRLDFPCPESRSYVSYKNQCFDQKSSYLSFPWQLFRESTQKHRMWQDRLGLDAQKSSVHMHTRKNPHMDQRSHLSSSTIEKPPLHNLVKCRLPHLSYPCSDRPLQK